MMLAIALGFAACRTTPPAPPPPPEAPAAPPPAAAAPQKPGRPADAVAFGGHWYKVFEADCSWHEKKARCEAMGGYLACIETEKEQAFIAELADGQYLSLGATDEKEEDTWTWINGAEFVPFGWMGGQPNNYGDDEHYLATYDGGEWVDVSVEGQAFWMPTGFICEWDK
jgi:hypothetical protein